MQLEQTKWEKPTSDFRDPIRQWSETTVRKYAQWCLHNGLVVPHTIKQMIIEEAAGEPTRPPEMPLRQFRRFLRKWRIKKFGSLSKKRAAAKAEKDKGKRWGVWIEQGIPLKDPEAIIWHIRENLVFKKRKSRYGTREDYQSWLEMDEIRKVTGGFIPPGIDFENEYRKIYRVKELVSGRRSRNPPYVFVQHKPKDKFMSTTHNAVRTAFEKAGFRHKFSFAYDIKIMLMRETGSIFDTPSMVLHDDPPNTYRRRYHRDTNVRVSVRLDWYRKVYMTGLANAFGPRTFVLDVHPTADGQRTVIKLFRQPSEHRYKCETVTGYLGRDINGNPKFMEE